MVWKNGRNIDYDGWGLVEVDMSQFETDNNADALAALSKECDQRFISHC
jgi:hypothetical protein